MCRAKIPSLIHLSRHILYNKWSCFILLGCNLCSSYRVSFNFCPLSTAGCAVNFEFQNYTIITSQCKGPQYPPKLCCGAFKEFACPFAEDINDLTNDCATTMFSYINLYGKYPPGLFASECREDKQGLACPDSPLGSSSEGSVSRPLSFPLVLILTVGVLLVFGQL